jgi:hypothetical protein
MAWVTNAKPRHLYHRERALVTTVQVAGYTLGCLWSGGKNLASTGVQTPNRQARSESLYQLRFLEPFGVGNVEIF